MVSADFEVSRGGSKEVHFLRREVARLRGLLEATRVDARKRSTIASLRLEYGALRDDLEAEIEKLRGTRQVLSKAVFGRRSERAQRPPSKVVAVNGRDPVAMAARRVLCLRTSRRSMFRPRMLVSADRAASPTA